MRAVAVIALVYSALMLLAGISMAVSKDGTVDSGRVGLGFVLVSLAFVIIAGIASYAAAVV